MLLPDRPVNLFAAENCVNEFSGPKLVAAFTLCQAGRLALTCGSLCVCHRVRGHPSPVNAISWTTPDESIVYRRMDPRCCNGNREMHEK